MTAAPKDPTGPLKIGLIGGGLTLLLVVGLLLVTPRMHSGGKYSKAECEKYADQMNFRGTSETDFAYRKKFLDYCATKLVLSSGPKPPTR